MLCVCVSEFRVRVWDVKGLGLSVRSKVLVLTDEGLQLGFDFILGSRVLGLGF